MNRNDLASTLLTGVVALYTSNALAKSRCEADLGRVDTNFCLTDRHLTAEKLHYNWSLNDDVFDLSSRACFSDGATGARRDTIIAIDRSQNAWYADTARGKFGSDNLSTARYLIEKLRDEARTNPAAAPKVGVVLFSSAPDCREWSGGPITVNREFPCVYVKAGSVGDSTHVDQLLGLLKAADKKYSQGSLASTSNYGIVADLLSTDDIGLVTPTQAGLMLFSDGRTYRGEATDPFAYLRSGNYVAAQDAAIVKFSTPAMHKYKTVFALTPVADPAFDDTHADAYDNMCSLAPARPEDCNKTFVTYQDPRSWPVNKLDLKGFAGRLTAVTSPSGTSVFVVTSKQDADPALEALRIEGGTFLTIDAVAYSVNGAAARSGSIESGRLYLDALPADTPLTLDLLLTSNGKEFKLPVDVTTKRVDQVGEFSDKEMLCKDGPAPETLDPLNLSKLQGGSGSCGVTGSASNGASALVLLFPLVAFLFVTGARRRATAGLIAAVAAFGLGNPEARAADAGGLNALQYRPVVDGVGSAESATTLGAGTYNVGLFADYANDTVELGGEKNERLNSIMDDLVTAHAVANFGLHRRLSLGVHVPYVQKSDVERAVGGEDVDGGQLGQPADVAATLKFSVLTRATYALALMPIATFSTGNPEYLLGDGTNNYGALFLVSGSQGALIWAYNAGYVQREKALRLTDDRASEIVVRGQFLNFGGVEYRYSMLWSFGANVQAKFSSGQSLDLTRSSPAEWTASAKLRPSQGLVTEAGFGTGLGKGYGSPDYRVFAGISYIPGASELRDRAATSTARAKPAAKPAKSKAIAKRPLAQR